jgi:dTDP-4-amino-4,6-dideoxygalactose transaminase
MILTSHDELAKKMRSLRFHGSGGNYYYDDIGWCSRLDEMQAAILRVKLRHLDKWNQMRTANAAYYSERLAGSGLVLPKADSANHHVWHQYTVRVEKRDELLGFLKERGIASAVYYPAALHLQPAYSYLGYSEGDFPEAERACQEVLSLPVIPELTEQAREMVADAVLDFQKSPAAAG